MDGLAKSNEREINTRFFKDQVRDALERGVDVQKIVEEQSMDHQIGMAKLAGVRRGIDLISVAYLAIVGSEIYGSFKGVHIDLDYVLVTVTASAVTGMLGFVFGKTHKK